MKRYGIGDKAHDLFLKEAEKCETSIEENELTTIMNSAVKFAKKVQDQEGYVAPEDFNKDFSDAALKPTDYSDIGQAKVLAREYDAELCFTEATDYLRYDGEKWVESKQKAVGAMEEFLDEQLADAESQVASTLESCIKAGLEKAVIITGKGLGEMNEEQQIAYGMYTAGAIDEYTVLDIEHILPNNPSSELRNDFTINNPGADYDEYKNRLGNLTLLEKPINIVASNDFFLKKCEEYKKSKYYLTSSILD